LATLALVISVVVVVFTALSMLDSYSVITDISYQLFAQTDFSSEELHARYAKELDSMKLCFKLFIPALLICIISALKLRRIKRL